MAAELIIDQIRTRLSELERAERLKKANAARKAARAKADAAALKKHELDQARAIRSVLKKCISASYLHKQFIDATSEALAYQDHLEQLGFEFRSVAIYRDNDEVGYKNLEGRLALIKSEKSQLCAQSREWINDFSEVYGRVYSPINIQPQIDEEEPIHQLFSSRMVENKLRRLSQWVSDHPLTVERDLLATGSVDDLRLHYGLLGWDDVRMRKFIRGRLLALKTLPSEEHILLDRARKVIDATARIVATHDKLLREERSVEKSLKDRKKSKIIVCWRRKPRSGKAFSGDYRKIYWFAEGDSHELLLEIRRSLLANVKKGSLKIWFKFNEHGLEGVRIGSRFMYLPDFVGIDGLIKWIQHQGLKTSLTERQNDKRTLQVTW